MLWVCVRGLHHKVTDLNLVYRTTEDVQERAQAEHGNDSYKAPHEQSTQYSTTSLKASFALLKTLFREQYSTTAHACNPSTEDIEEPKSRIQSQYGL